MNVLILGGTGEADQLAELLVGHGIGFIYSLAGVTRNPRPKVYPTRTGGFGGVVGLARYLSQNNIQMVIDATHPFAANMPANAMLACKQTSIAYLRLTRPPWPEPQGAGWQRVNSLKEAADILPDNARVFLSVGAQSMSSFAHRVTINFVSRVIQPPKSVFGKIIVARPPFDLAGETQLLRENKITHLVTKNAGGNQTIAKLEAAQSLGIKVIMVERPAQPVAEMARDIAMAMAWIERRL